MSAESFTPSDNQAVGLLPYQRVGFATGLLTPAGFSSTIFEEMSALANKYGAINLGQGFPDTDGPQEIFEAATLAMKQGLNQYTTIAGLPVLRQAIVEHQKRFYGLSLDPDTQVTVSAGASEALASSIAALVNPGDEVILFEPYYDLYPAAVVQAGGKIRTVPLLPPTFEPDVDDLEAAFSQRTAMIIVNDPHNPTGMVFSQQVKQKIVELAQRYDAVILTDSVYEHLVFEGSDYAPIQLLEGASERTIAVSAISKSHSLTGWRIGWMTGPADLIAKVRLVKGYYTHSAAAPLQAGAAAGIGLGDDYYDDYLLRYSHQRQILLDGLAGSPFNFAAPAGTFFAAAEVSKLLDSKGFEDADALARALPAEAGVAVVPMTAFVTDDFKPVMKNWVRFAFCKKPEVLEEAVSRLKQWAN